MRRQAQIALFSLICTGFCAASPAKPPRKPTAKAQVAPAPAPAEPAPVVPPPPPTLEQTPPSPPQVAMQNGLLSIAAENSMLGEVLNSVRKATGASMDVPPAAQSERVVVHLGPGQPGDVLRQLLAGSKFDYIIVGTPQDPMALQRVVLTMRNGGGGATTVANNNPVNQPPTNSYQPPGDYAQDEPVEEEPVQPEPASPEVIAQPQGPQQPPQAGPNQGPNQGPKTPEQLLQELQQMQQQQNQNGPQRPPRNPPSPQ